MFGLENFVYNAINIRGTEQHIDGKLMGDG